MLDFCSYKGVKRDSFLRKRAYCRVWRVYTGGTFKVKYGGEKKWHMEHIPSQPWTSMALYHLVISVVHYMALQRA